MLPAAIARYVGLPFADHGADWAGVSCYGLVVLYYREERGIQLPSYDEHYVTATDRHEIAALFDHGVPADWAPTETPHLGDAVVFRIGGLPLHCGLWVTPEYFLHCERGTATCVTRFTHPKWRARCLGAFQFVPQPALHA